MKLGQAASKKNILEALLQEGMVLVALDARIDEVEVPPHLAGDLQLRLNLSHRFGLPLDIDAWGVVATLTFAGNAFDCKVPWSAIFLLVSHASGQPYLFPEDIPSELLAQNQVEGQLPATPPSAPRLSLVTQTDDDRAELGDQLPNPPPPTRLRPVAAGEPSPATLAQDLPPEAPGAPQPAESGSPKPPGPEPGPRPRRAPGAGRHLKLIK